MSKPDIHLVDADHEIELQFRLVMRRLAGGVCVITAGRGDDITGMTVTSLTSLSASPPRLLVSINRQASSFEPIARHRLFGVNILGSALKLPTEGYWAKKNANQDIASIYSWQGQHDQAIAMCVEAGVRQLVLYHHAPSHGDDQMDRIAERYVAEGAKAGVEVLTSFEGMTVTIGPEAAA